MISANNITLRVGKKALFFSKMLISNLQKETATDLLAPTVQENLHF